MLIRIKKWCSFWGACAVTLALVVLWWRLSALKLKHELEPLNSFKTHKSEMGELETQVHPYLIAFHYDDQLGGAMRGFVQLVNITVHWNRRPVEPFVVASYLVAVPSPGDMRGIHRFSDLYDSSSVEVWLSECSSHPTSLSTFEEFLLNSTREFVLLVFSKGKMPGSIEDCTHAQSSKIRSVETKLNQHLLTEVQSKAIAKYGTSYMFKGIRAVCVDASKFLIREVERAVVGERPGDQQYTVVVFTWRYVKNVPDPFYFYDPSFGNLEDTCDYHFPHSALVVQSAEEFRTFLGLRDKYLGMHFRLEWLHIDNFKKPGHLEKCLKTAQVALKKLMKKYNITSESVIAINDYSNYGSNSISCKVGSHSKCDQTRKNLVDRLELWGVKTVAYDPAIFGKPLHRGFVSLVEKELLSNANYLVTVGGGIYQKSIRARFAKKHGVGQLFAMCQRKHADVLPNLDH